MADPTTERQLAGITSIFSSGMQVRLAIEVVGLAEILKEIQSMAASIKDVLAKVQSQTTVIQSGVTLLGQISQMLKDAQADDDPKAVQAVIDLIDTNTASLAKAVQDNTPGAPPAPTPTPTPAP